MSCRCVALIAFLIAIFYLIFLRRFQLATKFALIYYSPTDYAISMDRQAKVDYLKSLLEISRRIVRAHRYARTKEAIYELNDAFQNVNRLRFKLYHELEREILLKSKKSTEQEAMEICPEVYMGMRYGWPYYYSGYIFTNCTKQPISDLVSIILNVVDDIDFNDLELILYGLNQHYPNMKTLVAYRRSDKSKVLSLSQKFPKLLSMSQSIVINDKENSGKIWLDLAKHVTSKYTFVGVGLIRFDNYSLFDRLLLFANHLESDAIGGSHRFLNGKWFRGCFASRMQNYTLKLIDGYDLSYNSCIYCDYISGPFLTKTQTLLNHIDENVENSALVFLDFFTNLKTAMVCPDVMFVITDNHIIYSNNQSIDNEVWFSFVRKWSLNRLILPYGNRQIVFTCMEADISCARKAGTIMPICCLQELTDAAKFFAKIAKKYNVFYELDSGTTLGAVKFYGTLPYERDADFDWLSGNYTILQSLVREFGENSYRLVEEKTDYANCLHKTDAFNCGYFALHTENWRLELWGVIYLGSDYGPLVGLTNRTKILLDGLWVDSVHSPGLMVRNKFADEVYEHVEHWGTLGYTTSWVQPKTGSYLKCPRPGHHSCLENYSGVGNIQFQDVSI